MYTLVNNPDGTHAFVSLKNTQIPVPSKYSGLFSILEILTTQELSSKVVHRLINTVMESPSLPEFARNDFDTSSIFLNFEINKGISAQSHPDLQEYFNKMHSSALKVANYLIVCEQLETVPGVIFVKDNFCKVGQVIYSKPILKKDPARHRITTHYNVSSSFDCKQEGIETVTSALEQERISLLECERIIREIEHSDLPEESPAFTN